MAKNRGGADTRIGRKVSQNRTQTKKKPATDSGRTAAIVAVNDDELETAAESAHSTDSEKGAGRGAAGIEFLSEEEDENEAEKGGNQFLNDEKVGDGDGANGNAYGNRLGKCQKLEKNPSTKRRDIEKEKQGEREVKKGKGNAGSSQQTKAEKNCNAKTKANRGLAVKQAKGAVSQEKKSKQTKNGEKEIKKKLDGKKEEILKVKESSNVKKNQKREVRESSGNTKTTPKKGDEKTNKRKQRVEDDEEVRGKVAKKVKSSSGSGDKSQSRQGKKDDSKRKKNGKLEEDDEEGIGPVVAKKVKSNGQISRVSKEVVEKRDIKSEKKVENGAKRVSDSKGKRKDQEEEEAAEKEVKCESILYKFPMSRVSRIIKSEISNTNVSQEATFVINKATEKFLDLFSKEAYACAFLARKPYVGYDHLSSVVCKRKRFDFLSDFVPEKIKAKEALANAEGG
ncbi:hypothetical protein DM860_006248 [Cuscuta australis]|uniref:Transcription factor CBF/NF-Y/archaeal histone domain-containing protein n=1 Tax=Cuscuta australis TaxID=267555 RepID=A0A328DKJ7_9ASTE|nr:hypothetical protein DM860_006248 [Cuscuta australis]